MEVTDMLKFDGEAKKESIQGTLSLRPKINHLVDTVFTDGFKNLCWMGIGGTYASSLQAQMHMKERSGIEVFTENAAEYIVTGNVRIGKGTVVVISSVSGSTEEMIAAVKKVQNAGAFVLGFIDQPTAMMASEVDGCISCPGNEQLKFFMVADRFMYLAGEFPGYDDYYREIDAYLPEALASIGPQADKFAVDFVEKHHDDGMHYFVGAGNLYGATYSYAMCYWEEQHWKRTKSIHAAEFFHGMLEVIDRDTNVTVFVGEDSQRSLAERVAAFLPRICGRYTIIDTKDYTLSGISEKNRGSLSPFVMREICARIDVHLEKINCHPMDIRRYYRRLDY
jgi:fructoselysine-6-phosphate deglycase